MNVDFPFRAFLSADLIQRLDLAFLGALAPGAVDVRMDLERVH